MLLYQLTRLVPLSYKWRHYAVIKVDRNSIRLFCPVLGTRLDHYFFALFTSYKIASVIYLRINCPHLDLHMMCFLLKIACRERVHSGNA